MLTRQFATRRLGGFAAVIATSALALGADPAPQEVDCGGMTFQAPAAWKSSPPSSSMRRAQLKLPAENGADAAELIVFAFPEGAGSVDANVARWRNTFKDKDGNPPKVEVKKVQGKNVEVTAVEVAGHYYPMTPPGQPKQPDRDDFRLLGAIASSDKFGYYLRLVGPDKAVAAARPEFDKLMASMKVDGK